jgi:prenyltransferase beta subunit
MCEVITGSFRINSLITSNADGIYMAVSLASLCRASCNHLFKGMIYGKCL